MNNYCVQHQQFYSDYCVYCGNPLKVIKNPPLGEWSADYRSCAGTLHNCGVEHDYRFSHYEEDRNTSPTSILNIKYAIMICRRCGHYIKQQTYRP